VMVSIPIVRVSTIVLLTMFLLPGCGQDDNQPTSEAPTKTLPDLIKAAEQGDAVAQGNLGSSYSKGEGVTQDYVLAHMWYNLATSQLSGEDRETAVRNRDIIAEKMISEQLAEARRLAREWEPKSSGSQ